MKKIIRTFIFPLFYIKNIWENYLKKHDPERLFVFKYYRAYGIKLNINNPQTLYEKITYLAFRTDTSKWSVLADKVAVRDFVKERGLEESLNKLYGVYSSAEEIDYEKLPNAFVLKTNNASATNIIVKDKNKINKEEINDKLNKWLKLRYGYETCQPHYSRITPLILAEELLIDKETTAKGKMLIDYKFYCFNGVVKYIQVMTDRTLNSHKVSTMIFDDNWNAHPEYVYTKYSKMCDKEIPCPISFDRMKCIASKLSEGFPFVRVDFYEINGEPIFGEMTFTPGMDSCTYKFHKDLGEYCRI